MARNYVSSEKRSARKSHSGLRSLECVHYFFEINASGFWHCQVVSSCILLYLSSVLYTLEVYKAVLCACSTKLSLPARVTNLRFECSRLHTFTHFMHSTHTRIFVYRYNYNCYKCASLGFQLFQCRLHSWCLGHYRSTEGICKQNWHSLLGYTALIIVKFCILNIKCTLISFSTDKRCEKYKFKIFIPLLNYLNLFTVKQTYAKRILKDIRDTDYRICRSNDLYFIKINMQIVLGFDTQMRSTIVR